MSDFFVDTHCHLDLFKDIDKNPSLENQLPIKTISVTNAPYLYEPNKKLFNSLDNIRIALGMHPELVSKYHDQMDLFNLKLKDTRYIGEIGLDGSANYQSSFLLQKEIFDQLLLAVSKVDNKILTVHSRNAGKETIENLHKHLKNTNCKVILHWYSGNLSDLKTGIDYGYFFSINHKMAMSSKGKKIIDSIPTSQLLTETDAPFTFDSKISDRLKSLQMTINEISTLKHKSQDEIKGQIYENFKSLLS